MPTPPGFEVRTDRDGILWLSGELDFEQMDRFAQMTMASVDGQREIVLELSGLSFLDSSGIRAILQFASTVPKGVVLRNPRSNVQQVLQIVDIAAHDSIRLEP